MAFQNYNLKNNARTTLATGILAATTTISVKTGEGDLFATTN